MDELIFVTTNPGKVMEAREIAKDYNIRIVPNDYDAREIRSEEVGEIAADSALDAYEHIKKPLIVEDSGFFLDAFQGFPGTYSAFIFKKIGIDGVMRVMGNVPERGASMKSAVAFTDGKIVKTFEGEVKGSVPAKKEGEKGFGYDPIFIPEGLSTTFGEDPLYKAKVSHRARSLMKLFEWYTKKY